RALHLPLGRHRLAAARLHDRRAARAVRRLGADALGHRADPDREGPGTADISGRIPRMKTRAAAAALVLAAGIAITAYASQRTASAMAKAADKWLASLNADQKQRATFPFDSEERMRWHFVPNEQFPRKGV